MGWGELENQQFLIHVAHEQEMLLVCVVRSAMGQPCGSPCAQLLQSPVTQPKRSVLWTAQRLWGSMRSFAAGYSSHERHGTGAHSRRWRSWRSWRPLPSPVALVLRRLDARGVSRGCEHTSTPGVKSRCLSHVSSSTPPSNNCLVSECNRAFNCKP